MSDVTTWPVFLAEPDWTNPVVTRLRWRTGIDPADSGMEQRLIQRPYPQLGTEFTVASKGKFREARYVEQFYRKYFGQSFLCPLWSEATRKTTATGYENGFYVNEADYNAKSFLLNRPAMVWRGMDTYQVNVPLAAPSDAGFIGYRDAWANGHSTGDWLVPLIQCRALGTNRSSWKSSYEAELKMEADEDPRYSTAVLASSSAPTYLTWATEQGGNPIRIFPFLLDWANYSMAYSRNVSMFESESKLQSTVVLESDTRCKLTSRVYLDGRPDIAEMMAFMARCCGMARRFWLPTSRMDFRILSVSGNAITVEYTDFANHELLNPSGTYLFICDAGNWYTRQVLNVQASGVSTETIILTGTLPAMTNATGCFLMLCRSAVDDIELEFEHSGRATAKMTVEQLSEDYKEIVDGPDATGTVDGRYKILA